MNTRFHSSPREVERLVEMSKRVVEAYQWWESKKTKLHDPPPGYHWEPSFEWAVEGGVHALRVTPRLEKCD